MGGAVRPSCPHGTMDLGLHNLSAGNFCSDFPSLAMVNKDERCVLATEIETRAYTISAIRMITSFLGMLGALSIIVSALVRRRVSSSEVHPIFMLSLADCMLGLLWIVGAILWFLPYDAYNHIWCYALTLGTAILECVVINLTVVYGVFAYFRIHQTKPSGPLVNKMSNVGPCFVAVVYTLSWLFPFLVIIVIFGSTAVGIGLLHNVENCSCWCFPSIFNVLPSAVINGTHVFISKEAPFLLALVIFLAAYYIIGFILLVILYWRILKKVREIRATHAKWLNGLRGAYGAAAPLTSLAEKRQSQARKRIVMFLSVFVLSGFINLAIFIYLVFFLTYEFIAPPQGDQQNINTLVEVERDLLYAQSITLPLQGFLNAIVYGWTRDDFVHKVVGSTQSRSTETDVPQFITDSSGALISDSEPEDDYD